MVVCKFYLQGNCRFGNNCKFEHQISDFNAAVSTSILRQPLPPPQQQQPPQSQIVDLNVAIRSVANDMLLAEKGGQWLFSCYTPFKEKPPFPGFEDMSFEEIRYGFYTAQRNGTLEQYKQQLQGMLQKVLMQVRALQNPSGDVLNIIKNLFYSSNVVRNESVKNNFSFANAGKSVLQQQPQNIFAQASQSLFGGGNSSFASLPQSNVFQQQKQQPSNVFQQQQQPSNVFQQQQQQPSNVFQPQPPSSNVFQQQQPSNVFQQQQQVSNSSIFGGESSSSPMSAAGRAQNVDEMAYSKPEALSESEIKQFEADAFEFGEIPEKPPTVQMCF